MATLTMTADESELHRLVGTVTFLLGRDHVSRGLVVAAQRNPGNGVVFGQVGGPRSPHSAIASLIRGPGGAATAVQSECTCRSGSPGSPCSHAVAVLLATLPSYEPVTSVPAQPAPWERSLAPLIGKGSVVADQLVPAEIGLQFEIVASPPVSPRRAATTPPFRIGLRPVVPGRNGNWVRTGISWSALGYQGYSGSELYDEHQRLLSEILALATRSDSEYYYGYTDKTIYLENIASRRVWDLLAEAREVGLPLVMAGRPDTAIVLHSEPARASVQVGRTGSGLELVPMIGVAGPAGAADRQVELAASMLLGEPAHGIAWWQTVGEGARSPKDRILQLAPLAAPLDGQIRGLLTVGPITIPTTDENRFLAEYYPALRRRVNLVPLDESVDLPVAAPPVLGLTVDRLDGHRVELSWEWIYALGGSRRREPLWPSVLSAGRVDRDAVAEAGVVRAVTAAVAVVPDALLESPSGLRLASAVTLDGMSMIQFLNDVLPELRTRPDVEVTLDLDAAGGDPLPDYREAEEAPVVTISGNASDGRQDWFDLSVAVSVGDQEVPFNDLFVALAHHQTHLILRSGTYFSLDRPQFRQLSALIVEARELQDAPSRTPGSVRLSRFQAGLWAELEQIGVVSGQAAAWQESVRALGQGGQLQAHPVPAGLQAELRPYQIEGFHWLAALFRLGLGGVLADDMGLGKTLQALALICHVRENSLSESPFLVVAPTSVVFNWASEVDRFAPGLKVAVITETEARRGIELAQAIAGADVVVTSYTLFRLEYEAYETADWAGLVLDEAQFVKNHQSQIYQRAKRLPAPFKLAITGTPMENNLMELWSLLSITAPGLFANPTRFTEHYRTPIEKGRNVELLDRLRRRIRPLMLRRTKEQVATDLPDKQEQVIELELNPQHRKVYQTHLQRERQKVLGLIDDLKKNRFEIFRSLTLLRQASLDVGLIDPKYAKIPSTKLDAMMEQVTDIVGEGHRTLIFSQFTRFLDSARQRLEAAGIEHCYLDGSTRDRAAVLRAFKTGTAPVFLISLKAGGFGLNLTEADYCILLDPWWNPATEAQAVDRVHRIGQTRKVMVYRLVAKDTIEEKVMALKATKAALFDSVMDGGAFESAALSESDIRGLLE
jgi:superfamily II DNA or RNA helicase